MKVYVKYSELQVRQTAQLLLKTGQFANYTLDDMMKSIIHAIEGLALEPGSSSMNNQFYYIVHGLRRFETLDSDANTMTANIYINPCIFCDLEMDYVGSDLIVSDEDK